MLDSNRRRQPDVDVVVRDLSIGTYRYAQVTCEEFRRKPQGVHEYNTCVSLCTSAAANLLDTHQFVQKHG